MFKRLTWTMLMISDQSFRIVMLYSMAILLFFISRSISSQVECLSVEFFLPF